MVEDLWRRVSPNMSEDHSEDAVSCGYAEVAQQYAF